MTTPNSPTPTLSGGASHFENLLHRSGLLTQLEQFPWPALVSDQRRTIRYINSAAERYYDYRQEELVGLTPRLLLGRNISRKLFQHVARRIFGERAPYLGPLPQRRRNGRQEDRFAAIIPLVLDQHPRPLAYISCYSAPEEAYPMLSWLLGNALNSQIQRGKPSLTPNALVESGSTTRQEEIIRMFAFDYTAKEIASLLNISPSTVRVVRWKHRHGQSNGKTKGGRAGRAASAVSPLDTK